MGAWQGPGRWKRREQRPELLTLQAGTHTLHWLPVTSRFSSPAGHNPTHFGRTTIANIPTQYVVPMSGGAVGAAAVPMLLGVPRHGAHCSHRTGMGPHEQCPPCGSPISALCTSTAAVSSLLGDCSLHPAAERGALGDSGQPHFCQHSGQWPSHPWGGGPAAGLGRSHWVVGWLW